MVLLFFIREDVPVASLYQAVCRGFYVFVYRYRPDGVCNYASGHRVLDIRDGAFDVGIEGAVFKCSVAIGIEGASLKHEVVGIAEGLLPGDMAIYES